MPERDPLLDPVVSRELQYHEELYSGFAQNHFAKPAVVAFRRHLVERIVRRAGIGSVSRVLSIGCGIGDTELLLARYAGHVTGVDLSPRGIEHANRTARSLGVGNVEFQVAAFDGSALAGQRFDAIIGVFFLHHLAERIEAEIAPSIHKLLRPGGTFYGIDPSRYRLSGFIGKLLFPSLMKKYQSDDEEQLSPVCTAEAFRQAGFQVEMGYYDFLSTPLAGLLPDWGRAYRGSRILDNLLVRTPLLRRVSSNFEIVARRPA